MLTKTLRNKISNMEKLPASERRVVRKRVLDDCAIALEDLVMVLKNAEKFPNAKEKIRPEMLEALVFAYFESLRVDVKYSSPERVIRLLDENASMMKKSANLERELAEMMHQIEHFKYLYTHISRLMEINGTTIVERVVSAP